MIKILMACLGMAVLILDSKTAFSGALEGIELCIRTVIPSLFPFFVLSILLTSYLSGTRMPFLRPIGRLFRCPSGAEPLLLTGFLGGYPVGAQSVSQAYQSGQFSSSDAQRMLVICNQCGPAFLFGMVSGVFEDPWAAWMIWLIIVCSAWLLSMLLPGESRSAQVTAIPPLSFLQAMDRSIRILARVCGWIVLFRIVLCFLQRWMLWYFSPEIRCLISGSLELANGCMELKSIANEGLRFMICTGLLCFGGLCVTMQTLSVIAPELDRRYYFPGKVFQGCAGMCLAYLVQLSFEQNVTAPPWIPILIGMISTVILMKMRKKCSISRLVGV